MTDEQIDYTWKRSTTPPWIVIDWQGHTHQFQSEQQQWDFIEREKRMLANASRAAMEDVTVQITRAFQDGSGVESNSEHEQTAGTAGPPPQAGEAVGRYGNRRSRRRARRIADSKKASG
jgi:hypothetical protein